MDAHFKELNSEAAVNEIIHWDRILIKLIDLPKSRERTRIKKTLMDIAGACWHQNPDENDDDTDKISLTPEIIDSLFDKFKEEAQRIKGYQAMAIIETNGKLLAAEQNVAAIDLPYLAEELNQLFSSDKSRLTTLHSGESVILHKQNQTIFIVSPKKPTRPAIRLMGITTFSGNWFYMKMALNKIFEDYFDI